LGFAENSAKFGVNLMTRKPPYQIPLAFYLGEPSTGPLKTVGGTPFSKLVTLWIPRQFLTSSDADVEAFVEDVNEKLAKRRGYVLWDGQILFTPLKMSDSIELVYEGHNTLDAPPYRPWGELEREYFGLKNPYQMIEDYLDYTESCISARILEPYLFANERISAILHGRKDNYYFYCQCHQADVVYTTAHRLVCMGCGAMHAVLRQPLAFRPKRVLTAQEWSDFFDDDGTRREEEIDLSILDFREVESIEMLWTTENWENAKHEFVFFARSSPEEIAEAIRGTERDPSVFLEAGWTAVPTSPPPALQVVGNSVDVDLMENAGHSIAEGVASYLAARKISDKLVTSVPQLFKGIELLLKSKLQELDARGLQDQPNTPTVLKRLAGKGVALRPDELMTLQRLRRWRNDLQHGTATFNHRAGLSTCRSAIILLDRFSQLELGLWLGDVVPADDWYMLLKIPEIATGADAVVARLLDPIRQNPDATISDCPRCCRETLIRPHRKMGAQCIRCGYVPVLKGET
jgi:hypothetical protein